MKIKSLKLKNFRNYELLNLEFDGSTNIFYGDNAQGKTNILEAVYLSGTTKSHRGSKDRDMIRFGAEESHIEVIVEKRGIQDQIDMHLKKNRPKGVAINKIPIRKAGELFGIVNLVFFSPEDLNIIKNGPAGRRKFIDLELSQLDKVYFNHLSNYSRIVNQRNHLLKDSAYRQDAMETLDIWDLQLVQYGNAIIARRKQFVDEMNEIVSGIHKKLTGGKEEIRLIYEPSTKNMSLEQALGDEQTARYQDEEYFGRASSRRRLFYGRESGHPEIRIPGTAKDRSIVIETGRNRAGEKSNRGHTGPVTRRCVV